MAPHHTHTFFAMDADQERLKLGIEGRIITLTADEKSDLDAPIRWIGQTAADFTVSIEDTDPVLAVVHTEHAGHPIQAIGALLMWARDADVILEIHPHALGDVDVPEARYRQAVEEMKRTAAGILGLN
jgi:hypothetical protein